MSLFISPFALNSSSYPEFNPESCLTVPESERLIENSELTPYSDADLPSYDCDLKLAYRECGSKPCEFVLGFEYNGPKEAKIIFSPVFGKSSNPSRACLFISILKENQEGIHSTQQIKAKFDLSDPKYAPFLERFSTPTFKIRFIDSNLHFEDLVLEKPDRIKSGGKPNEAGFHHFVKAN